jgi:hypothetical protein
LAQSPSDLICPGYPKKLHSSSSTAPFRDFTNRVLHPYDSISRLYQSCLTPVWLHFATLPIVCYSRMAPFRGFTNRMLLPYGSISRLYQSCLTPVRLHFATLPIVSYSRMAPFRDFTNRMLHPYGSISRLYQSYVTQVWLHFVLRMLFALYLYLNAIILGK